ncbi:hypothetical protein FDUTEX481_06974 [Tolypothrix sp. PCC 7601]|nr:hypothetical protein FDUTEX481_06974 [Tolypothrix sp. PCC 7601]BAY88377.1 hypothetical protein NIES3275_03520 [Microchaete diplosiphon NIES-3275]
MKKFHAIHESFNGIFTQQCQLLQRKEPPRTASTLGLRTFQSVGYDAGYKIQSCK